MRARDWLLLLIAADGAPSGLDPVRLQKGMFLLAEEAGLPARERYRFVPYNYGPMSRGLYRGLRALVREGLVERRSPPALAWGRYVVTPAGAAAAAELVASPRPRVAARLRRLEEIKAAIAMQSFSQLLAEVYDRYPDYTTRSVFRR